MAESAPFVSLESQDDMWDDDNSDDLSGGLQPSRVHFNRSMKCSCTNVAIALFIGMLIIGIIVLSALVARRKETKNLTENLTKNSTESTINEPLCLKPECIKASYGE